MFFILILIALLIVIAILYYSVIQYRKTLPNTETNATPRQEQNHLAETTFANHQHQDPQQNAQQNLSTPVEQTDFAEKAQDLAQSLGGLQASFSNGNTLPDGNEVAPFIRYCREVFYYIQQHRHDLTAIQDYFSPDALDAWQTQPNHATTAVPQHLLAHLLEQGTVEQDDELLFDWVKVRFTGTWQDLNSEKNQEFIQIWTYQKDIDAEQWLIHDIEHITTD